MATLTTSYQLIATGSSQSFNSVTGYVQLYGKYNSQSIDNNTSSVSWQLRLVVSGGYIGDYNNNKPVKITGMASSQTTYIGSGNYKSQTLATFTETVSHNADGTKSGSASGSVNFTAWGKTLSVSGSATLPTIPRASSITATASNINEVSQITVTKASSSFTHSIGYSFGSLSGYILADGTTTATETKFSETSVGFTVPTSFYAQIPNAKNGTCTLTCKTYNGSTLIGTKTTTFIATAKESTVRPTVSASVVDTNSTTIALTGSNNRLVKGYSTASITWSASANQSATISSKTINGTTVSTSPYVISNYSADAITLTATDSRGYSSSVNASYTAVNYFIPNVNIVGIRPSPTSNSIQVKFSGQWFNANFGSQANTLAIKYRTRIKNGTWSSYTNLTLNTHYKISGNTFYSGTGTSASEITLTGTYAYSNTYEVEIVLTDKLNTKASSIFVSRGIPNINIYEGVTNINGTFKITKNGLGVTIGSDNASFCHYKTEAPSHWFNKTVKVQGDIYCGSSYNQKVLNASNVKTVQTTSATDTYSCTYINGIVESGSNSNGSWVKYVDGTMICYMNKTYNTTVANTWGSVYESARFSLGNFPQTFIEVPTVSAQTIQGVSVWLESLNTTTTSLGSSWLMSPVKRATASDIVISFTAIGKWK